MQSKHAKHYLGQFSWGNVHQFRKYGLEKSEKCAEIWHFDAYRPIITQNAS